METQLNSTKYTFLRAKIPLDMHTEIAVYVARTRRDWSEVIEQIINRGMDIIRNPESNLHQEKR